MARKRMFDLEIINQDSFYELPMEAKALYFLLGMEADDEGFISPKKILRLYGGTEDSVRILIIKGYIIPFNSGVVVITDWKRNNYLDKNRIKETIYQEEKDQLKFNDRTEKYELKSVCLTDVKQMLNQYSIEEYSIEENSIVENSIVENKIYCPAEAVLDIPFSEIIDYLNEKANTNYRHTTQKTKTLIKARYKEGFNIQDFKVVIDKKCIDWLHDKDMKKYLRPETLFGTKFESYLNQPMKEITTADLDLDFSDFR